MVYELTVIISCAIAQKNSACEKMERSDKLEIQIGVPRFKELLKSVDGNVQELAGILCTHEQTIEAKKKCHACYMRITRAKLRVEKEERKEKTFDTIEVFENIPEIAKLKEQYRAKKNTPRKVNDLKRFWLMLEKKRPILWDEDDVIKIVTGYEAEGKATYGIKQSLRMLFRTLKKYDMLDHEKLRARARDLQPNLTLRPRTRQETYFTTNQVPHILEVADQCPPIELDCFNSLILKLHLTERGREGDKGKGSFIDGKWEHINWNDYFYGEPITTISVFEPKTGGGTWWRHCPIDLWWRNLSFRLKQLKEIREAEDNDYIFPSLTYRKYQELWVQISEKLGQKLEPHDCRRSPSGWLRDLGLSDLAIGQYDTTSGEAMGYTGVGWENAEMFYQRYGKMNPIAIYDKSQRLDIRIFDGLILKILENIIPQLKQIQAVERLGLC